MGIVTVSRQYGAGGRRVASELADALGFRLVDRELAEEAARRLGVDPEVAESRDERAPAVIEEIGLALAAASAGLGEFSSPEVDDRRLAEATRRVILSLADAGGYVVLGRGAQAALAGRADACHIFLVGDIHDRIRRIMNSQHLDEREAAARCTRMDAERAGYVRRFYGGHISDPLLYDCVLNTSRLGLEGAVQIALAVARRKLGLR